MTVAGNLAFIQDLERPETLSGSQVLALTPDAYGRAKDAGLDPTVATDHAPLPGLCFDPGPYLRWQLDWLRRLDQLTGGSGVVLALAQLLATPLDSVVVRARLLAGVVDAVAPACVSYHGPNQGGGRGYHNGHLQFWPALGDEPLAARLLPGICAARSLPYRATLFEAAAPATPRGSLIARARKLLSSTIGPYRHMRITSRRRTDGTTLMLWHTGYGAGRLLADERRHRRRLVFLRDLGDSVWLVDPDPTRPRRGTALKLDLAPPGPLSDRATGMLDEVDEWAGVEGAGRLMASRLETFLGSICPAVERTAGSLAREFERFAVDRVVATNPSSVGEFACLVGASRAGLRTTLFQHGDHLFSYVPWLITETTNFEEMATSDWTVAEDLREGARQIGATPPRLVDYAPRVDALAQANRARGASLESLPVCYVPGFFVGDSYRVGGAYFEDAWYHRWHLVLLDIMAARPDVRFVWKALPAADQAADPIPELIKQRGLRNVEYEVRPFLRVQSDVGRVIIDFASTALYEAVRLEKPVLALAFSAFAALRPAAADRFAPILRICGSEDEAADQVRRFLDEPADRWVLPADRLAAAGAVNQRVGSGAAR